MTDDLPGFVSKYATSGLEEDKAETFAMAEELGGRGFLDLVIEDSHSCYLGDRAHRHDWGYGCGTCPACRLRAEGFAKFIARKM